MAIPFEYSLHNIKQRWHVTIASVVGIGVVVAVFMALVAMAEGFFQTLRATGRADNAIIVQRGSQSEPVSYFSRDAARTIEVDSRVQRDGDGRPMASTEVVVLVNLPKKTDGSAANVTLRGVTSQAFEVRGGVHITEGRIFRSGLPELIVGSRIQSSVRGLGIGSTLRMQQRNFTIVGVFSAEGGAFESEIWGPEDIIAPAFHRDEGWNSLVVRLADPRDLESLNTDLRARRDVTVEVHEERDYYEQQASAVTTPLLALTALVCFVMGLGAVVGAMNTMSALVSGRVREVGTFRAIGFSRWSILSAFMMESLLCSTVGGALGCLLAFPFHGIEGSTEQTAGLGQIAWTFRLTFPAILAALALAALMGLMGGLLPAIRAARLPITSALRGA